MSESRHERFEAQFAVESAEAGVELSLAEIRAARGPDGTYGQYPYMQRCWNRFQPEPHNEALAGDAQ